MSDSDFFSFDKALDKLSSLEEEDLKRLISAGEIRAFRDGSKMRLRAEDVDRVAGDLGFGEPISEEDAGEVLLEPIMKLEVNVPDDHVGDIVGDLQQRRALITGTNSQNNVTVVEAEVPLSKMFGYSGAMRSLSQGRASCSMEPLNYAAAPDSVKKEILDW